MKLGMKEKKTKINMKLIESRLKQLETANKVANNITDIGGKDWTKESFFKEKGNVQHTRIVNAYNYIWAKITQTGHIYSLRVQRGPRVKKHLQYEFNPVGDSGSKHLYF